MSGLLRICTAGSVDDGKSTLIGRLLYDSRAVYEDQVASVEKASKNRVAGPIDFSLFTDGLKAEREQGITIDVAYRSFNRYALFALGLQAVGEQREVDRSGDAVLRRLLDRGHLIFVDRA